MPRRTRRNEITPKTVSKEIRQLGMKEMADLFDAMAESGELADQSALQVVDQLISCQLIGNGNRTADRYKKAAKLFFPSADFNNLLYLPQRHLNIPLIDQLKTCEFIDSELNIMIQSATGGGNYAKQLIMQSKCRNHRC